MSYNTDHYQAVLDRIVRAEREGAALILQAHEILAEAKTDRRNVVTEYDRRIWTPNSSLSLTPSTGP